MARNQKAKKVITETGVRFDFANGETLDIDVTALADDIRLQSAKHGVSQKVGDSYAGAETVQEAVEAATAVAEALKRGEWSTRTPGAPGAGKSTILVEALFRVTQSEGRTLEECEELVAEMSDEQKEGLRNLAPIKAAVETIKLERQTAKAEKARTDAAGKPLDLSTIGL